MFFNPFIRTSVLRAEMAKIMAALDNLKKEVQETRDLTRSAITLLNGLKTKLDEAIASNDMGAVQALADELDTNQTELADAISANTPAEQLPGEPDQAA
jgi:hypothetical protein